jgi:hypothetical protein
MTTDWIATGAMLQGIAGVFGACSVLGAAWVGSNTFKQWLRQKQTERKIAVGEELLTILYTAADAFRHIRLAGALGYETNAARQKLTADIPAFGDMPEEVRMRMESAQVILSRLDSYNELWKRYFTALPTVRAFFGREAEADLRHIWKYRVTVLNAAQSYARARSNISPDRSEKIESAMWQDGSDSEDAIMAELSQITTRLEDLVLPIIRGD